MTVDKDDIYSVLSAEERAALDEDGFSDEDAADMARAEAAAKDDEGDDPAPEARAKDDEEADDEPEAKPEKAEAKKESAPEAEDGPAAETADDEPEEKFKPRYTADLPADFDAKMKALESKREELAEQFKAGEIEFDEFRAQDKQAGDELSDLKAARIKADALETINEQSAQQEWNVTVRNFFRRTAKAEGIDYAKDAAMNGDLDLFVKALAADPKNASRDGDWFLAQAHSRVKALRGIADKAPESDRQAIAEAAARRKVDKTKITKTLATVPGSEDASEIGGEFADIDGLEGLDLERAFASMSKAQREKYLAGNP